MEAEQLREAAEIVGKLVLAVILGGLIGWQREMLDRPAGLRTHILVCVGSTVYMLVSTSFFGTNADAARIAAQVATGMGFLGAGTIIRQGSMVRGLTTAASMWVMAAIGLCVGRGGQAYLIAVVAAGLVFLTLTPLRALEKGILRKREYRQLLLQAREAREQVASLQEMLNKLGVEVRGVGFGELEEDGYRELRLSVRIPPEVRAEEITNQMAKIERINSIRWE